MNKLQFLFELDDYYMSSRPLADIPYPFWFGDGDKARNPTLGDFLQGKADTKHTRLLYLLKVWPQCDISVHDVLLTRRLAHVV